MSAIDWPGLLAWSTKYHDGTKSSEFKQMSDEDREFLQKAMEDAFGKIEDPNQVMAEAITQLKAAERTDESVATALEIIDRCCDDPDCSRNVEKLDGLQPLIDLLKASRGHANVLRTLEILALLFANNPQIQEAGMKRGAMDAFLPLIKEAEPGSESRSKAFRAVVALVRKVAPLEDLFLRARGGLELLAQCFTAPGESLRMREKAASFVRSLAQDGRLQPEEAVALATAIAPLVCSDGLGHIQYREILTSCAEELLQVAPERCGPLLQEALAQAKAEEHEAARASEPSGSGS